LTISAWGAWNDAELTQSFPANSAAFGLSGDRLPYSSRFSANVSVDEEFPLFSRATGFIGGAVNYVGSRMGEFTSSAQRTEFPAYATTELRAGMRLDDWTVHLFVNNLTDRRGVLYGGLGSNVPMAYFIIQPRTAGLSIDRKF
jgi:outer membrane receptor protein involved in Fe transport